MTSEIAILNRQAIALAADSAVTINYPGGQKIYNSVNKLFTLSKYAPVGVMVYGVADLTGVPWETIIKSFRQDLGEKKFPEVRQYGEMLVSYIKDHKLMFTPELQEQQLLASVLVQLRSVLGAIDRALQKEIDSLGAIDDRQVQAITTRVIRENHEYWTAADRLANVPANHSLRIRRKWSKQIDAVINVVFERLPVSRVSRTRLREIAGLVFTADLFPDNVSGVVVAGFGEAEYFPSLVAYDMEGVLLNFVKVRENADKSSAITGRDSSVIIPFAQGDMVNLFMEGIDRRFVVEIENALTQFVDGLPDVLADASQASGRREKVLRRQISQAADVLRSEFIDRLGAHSALRHIQPIVTAVANLPKEELASMADSLVSLTSFKRRVTKDPETVGGPVDVAVISKGDGFVWIRRKHYFDPTLNHQFFANYYRA